MARILIGNVKGPIGATGPVGPRGPEGPQGIQGPLCPLTNNALATVPGVAALDAVMGKTLSDKDTALQNEVTKLNSELKIYALEAKPLGSVYDADNYYNNYSNLLPGCAWYRFVSSHAMLHPELGGGVLYVEGFKTDNEYEYQSACTYSQSGYKEYRRSKSAGSWGHWVAN